VKKLALLGAVLVLAASLIGCGGGDDPVVVVTGPGLVGIDDRTTSSAPPRLRVTYMVPLSPTPVTANIFSDPSSDGDIEFDRVLATFFVTMSPPVVLFGEDSQDANLPEFRAFLTFPLDGSTGQPAVPGDAVIVSATLEVLVDRVDFASVVPAFIDLVEYPVTGLSAADFNSVPLAFQSLDFFFDDPGSIVAIDVTQFMQLAQTPPALLDFQVRFLVDTGSAALSLSRTPSVKADRTVRPLPRPMDNIVPNRGIPSAKPEGRRDPTSKRR
jgi:hypothetical protein